MLIHRGRGSTIETIIRIVEMARRLERGPMTREQYHERWGGKERTFRRDMERLHAAGEPVFYDYVMRAYRRASLNRERGIL